MVAPTRVGGHAGGAPSNAVRCKKTFTPVRDMICLQMYQLNQTQGGLALPDISVADDVSAIGFVISVGPDVKQVKEGDVVVCNPRTAAQTAIHGGEPRLITVKEEHILGVVTDEYKDWRPNSKLMTANGQELKTEE